MTYFGGKKVSGKGAVTVRQKRIFFVFGQGVEKGRAKRRKRGEGIMLNCQKNLLRIGEKNGGQNQRVFPWILSISREKIGGET